MKLSTIKPVLTAAILAASLGALPAHADNLYVGAALGLPHFGAGNNGFNGITGQGSGVSSKLFGGYQFTPNFALEAGVADLGHIKNDTGSVSSQGVFLDAVGLLPLTNKWSLLGSLGVAHVNLNTSNGDASGNGAKVGLGAQYALTSNVVMRGEWEGYRPSAFGDKPKIEQFTIGARMAF